MNIILGTPCSLYPHAPKDQSSPKKEKCPECKNDIWISEKKKKLSIAMPNSKILCWFCLINETINNKDEYINMEQINLDNVDI